MTGVLGLNTSAGMSTSQTVDRVYLWCVLCAYGDCPRCTLCVFAEDCGVPFPFVRTLGSVPFVLVRGFPQCFNNNDDNNNNKEDNNNNKEDF